MSPDPASVTSGGVVTAVGGAVTDVGGAVTDVGRPSVTGGAG
ncbi:hypothetical protein ACFQ9U_24980 [Streptomyces sp. NPDC056568]